MMKSLLLFLWCLNVYLIFAQDCATPGKPCNDGKQCCGGCCIQGKCISTYQNCEEVEDPCLDDYCGPGFECHMYQPPPSCVGCNAERICRPFKDPGPGHY